MRVRQGERAMTAGSVHRRTRPRRSDVQRRIAKHIRSLTGVKRGGVKPRRALFFSTLQSLNKFNAVYLTTLLGYATNALLDVPLMLLSYALGFQPFIGAILASILGYSVSVVSTLIILRKEHHLKYQETFKMLVQIIVPTVLMVLVVVGIQLVLPLELTSKVSCIFYVAVVSIVGAFVYLFIAYKSGILEKVFGREYLNRIVKKLTFGKIKLS